MRSYCIILLMLTAFIFSAFAQQPPEVLWENYYFAASPPTQCTSIKQLSDGNYVFVGEMGLLYPTVLLMKITSTGDVIWGRSYSDSIATAGIFGTSFDITSNGGYVALGQEMGGTHSTVIKANSNGDPIWILSYEPPLSFVNPYRIIQTHDGGFFISGTTIDTVPFFQGALFIMKIDASGVQQWTEIYYPDYWDIHGGYVEETPDGYYMLCGYGRQNLLDNFDIILTKVDDNGDIIWQNQIQLPGFQWAGNFRVCTDGGFLISGANQDVHGGTFYFMMMKTDSLGILSWMENTDLENAHCADAVETPDGGYLGCGWITLPGTQTENIYLAKVNADGQLQWQENYGNNLQESIGNSILLTSDGGYAVGGTAANSAYVLKLDSEPPTEVTVNLTPSTMPIQIPTSGGSFSYNIALANISTAVQNFDFWSDITLPNFGTIPILNVQGLNLQPGITINRDRTQVVPAGAPMGIYTYYAYVGDYPWVVDYTDSFEFFKTGGDNGVPLNPAEWLTSGEAFEDEVSNNPALVPANLVLAPPCPNPFNSETVLRFSLPQAGYISLTLYDVQGREVMDIFDDWKGAGSFEVKVDGSGLSSGIYWVRLTQGNNSAVQKVVYVK